MATLSFLLHLIALLYTATAQSRSGSIRCGAADLPSDAQQLCSEAFGLSASGRTITYGLSNDRSEIRYTSPEVSAFDVTTCTRANLNLSGEILLATGQDKVGFGRDSPDSPCTRCASRSFCQGGARLLEDCPCESCSRGSSFVGNLSDAMLGLRCARCPYTCSSLGVEIMPVGGDTCFICNEELSLPNFDQNNCLTLEGWWVEKVITLEDIRSLVKQGPRMLFSDRLKRCFPNPDAPLQTIQDSLELRELGGEVETTQSHCRRNSLIYPVGNFSTAAYEVDERCNEPSAGGLCLGCEPGFTKRGSYFGNCTMCGELDTAGVAVRIVFNIWVVMASVYFTLRTEADYRRNKGEPGRRSLRWTLWKIFISHLQMLSAFAFVSIPWKDSALALFEGSEYLSVARIDLSCLYPEDFFRQELVYILVFWLAMLLGTFITVFFHHLYQQRGCDVCALKQENLNVRIDVELMWNKIVAALVAAVIAMHFLCTSIVLQLLSCVSVDFENKQLAKSYLLKDAKLQCWTGELGIWQLAVGVPVVVLLLIFIPLYLCWLIRKRRFAFLTYFYKEELAYWDVVVLWRKIFFLFTVVLLTDYGEAVESANAAIVLGLGLALHCYYLPYSFALANFMDGLGLLVLMFTLSVGSFQSSPKISLPSRTACNAFLIAVNLIYALIFPVLVCLDFFHPKLVEDISAKTEQALKYFFPQGKMPEPPPKTVIVDDPEEENNYASHISGMSVDRNGSAGVSIPQLRGNVLGVASQGGSPTAVAQASPSPLSSTNEKGPKLRYFSSSEILERVNQAVKTHSSKEIKET